jgi:glycerophosphoryl diester phosphodiesterase
MNTDNIPLLVAHRGYMHYYPENTWRSLEAALQAGACWVEFDIQLCTDGEFILLHDDNFERTSGINKSPFNLASHQIQLSVHEPARFGNRHTKTPVATLADILNKLSSYPSAHAMVELKQESINHWGLNSVMEKLLPLLDEYKEQCCLISFNSEALRWCRSHSTLEIGWVLDSYDARNEEAAKQLQAEFLICDYRKIPESASLWSTTSQWMLYDVMDPGAALDWAQRGATLIETADIGKLLQDPILGQRACAHGP